MTPRAAAPRFCVQHRDTLTLHLPALGHSAVTCRAAGRSFCCPFQHPAVTYWSSLAPSRWFTPLSPLSFSALNQGTKMDGRA